VPTNSGDSGESSLVTREVEQLVERLRLAAQSQYHREALLINMGWNPDELPLDELPNTFQTVFNAVQELANLAESPPESLDEFVEALTTVANLFEALSTVGDTISALQAMDEEDFEQFGQDLVSFITVDYLRSNHPVLHQLAWLLAIYEQAEFEAGGAAQKLKPLRIGGPDPTLAFERLTDLFDDPTGTLTKAYAGADTIDSTVAARRAVERALQRIAALLQLMGVDAAAKTSFLDQTSAPSSLTNLSIKTNLSLGEPMGALIISIGTHAPQGVSVGGSASTQLDIRLAVYFDQSTGEFSLLVEPAGQGTYMLPTSGWRFAFELAAEAPGMAITPDGIVFEQGSEGDILASATASKLGGSGDAGTGTGAAFTIGGTDGTRIEIGAVEATLGGGYADGAPTALVGAKASDSALIISPDDADNFLQQVLPDEELEATFDLGIGYSTSQGVYVEGGGGLEVTLPIHQSLLEVITLETVDIAVLFGDRTEGALAIDLGATVTLAIGPVDANVKGIGLSTTLTFPGEGTGNLGLANADFGFKPPDGVGLGLEAGAVSGGGFLEFEPEKHRYSGTFELTIGDYSVKVVGLLKTELESSDGFSLLVLITGEFPPVQLGFGFTLTGIGGLAGIHRNMKTKPLQNAVQSGNMGSVLFPENVVENAQQIITDLRTIFPPTKDVHVFGPMAKFSWGTPTMITMDVGIILSIPTWKIAILGKLQMSLPDPEKALVDLKLAVLGILDIPNQKVSIDASLYDSKIALFDVSGDMALRSSWGDDSSFMLSVGGFHPRYSPPKSFPELNRVKASLSKGGGGVSAKIELSAYMSVTPNTFQVGAGLVLKASAGPASVDGELSFDALFEFDPFAFIVDFFAKLMVDIKAFRLGVKIDGTLKGPKPMQIKGALTVEIAFVSTTVHVDVSIGSKPEQTELPSAKVFPDLREELARPQNWDASRPEGNAAPVSLYDPTKTDGDGNGAGGGDQPLLVHPLGTISVRQKIVPLGISIEKYGNADPRNTRFEVSEFSLADQSLSGLELLRENFAPAKYRKMSDSEKLDSEAFEKLPAGRRFTNDRCTYAHGTPNGDQKLEKTATMEYESSVIDEQRDDDKDGTEDLSPAQRTLAPSTSRELLKTGAVATSDARTTGTDRYRADGGEVGTHSGGSSPISIGEDAYVVVRVTGLDHVEMDAIDDDNPIEGTTQTEARQAKRAYAAAGHADADNLRVVGAHEVRSWTVVKAADGSRVNVGSAAGVESIFGGVRKAEAHAAMEAYAEETAVDTDDFRVVPKHEVGTPQEDS